MEESETIEQTQSVEEEARSYERWYGAGFYDGHHLNWQLYGSDKAWSAYLDNFANGAGLGDLPEATDDAAADHAAVMNWMDIVFEDARNHWRCHFSDDRAAAEYANDFIDLAISHQDAYEEHGNPAQAIVIPKEQLALPGMEAA